MRFPEGPKIRALRESRGITQKEVSQRGQLRQATLSRIEDGLENPSLGTLRRIAAGLDLPILVLLLVLFGVSKDLHENVPDVPENALLRYRHRLLTDCLLRIEEMATAGQWHELDALLDVLCALTPSIERSRPRLMGDSVARYRNAG